MLYAVLSQLRQRDPETSGQLSSCCPRGLAIAWTTRSAGLQWDWPTWVGEDMQLFRLSAAVPMGNIAMVFGKYEVLQCLSVIVIDLFFCNFTYCTNGQRSNSSLSSVADSGFWKRGRILSVGSKKRGGRLCVVVWHRKPLSPRCENVKTRGQPPVYPPLLSQIIIVVMSALITYLAHS